MFRLLIIPLALVLFSCSSSKKETKSLFESEAKIESSSPKCSPALISGSSFGHIIRAVSLYNSKEELLELVSPDDLNKLGTTKTKEIISSINLAPRLKLIKQSKLSTGIYCQKFITTEFATQKEISIYIEEIGLCEYKWIIDPARIQKLIR